MSDTVIRADSVSKKFCRRLRHSMMYGTLDVARGMLGMEARTDTLRNGEFWAVKDVSFELKRGETLGLIGPNGSGKSTLLRLLNGIFQPDMGRIEIKGRVGALIAVGAGFHPLMTGRENIYVNGSILGMTKADIDRQFDEIVEFADIGDFLDAPVKTYSSGMRVRLGFAVAIHCEPDILLIDEVLAVGDVGFQRKCFDRFGKLRKSGVSIVLVTHNMHQLSTVVDRAILLQDGNIEFAGEVEKTIELYMECMNPDIFGDGSDDGIEKVVNGNDKITVNEVHFEPGRELSPGDSLKLVMNYTAQESLQDVEVDIVLLRNSTHGMYFQCTNRTVGNRIDITKGDGKLEVLIEDIPINSGTARLAVALWKKDREELLFWWRNIGLKFNKKWLSSGDNFLSTSFSCTGSDEHIA